MSPNTIRYRYPEKRRIVSVYIYTVKRDVNIQESENKKEARRKKQEVKKKDQNKLYRYRYYIDIP